MSSVEMYGKTWLLVFLVRGAPLSVKRRVKFVWGDRSEAVAPPLLSFEG